MGLLWWLESWKHRNEKQLCTEKEVVRHAQLEVCVDSDWAGDLQSRRSTTGMAVTRGSHLLWLSDAPKQHRSQVRQRLSATHWFVVHGLCLGVQSCGDDWKLIQISTAERSFAKSRDL